MSADYIKPLQAPGSFKATAGNGEVELSWTAPPDSGGDAALEKYQYRYEAGSSVTTGSWTDVADSSDTGSDVADETGLTVTGLTNGTEYAFELRAVNASPQNNGNGAAATATATLAASPTVWPLAFFAMDSSKTLESLTHSVRVNFIPALTSDITLTYTVSGTATSGTDYMDLPGSVTVKFGATTATIPIVTIHDKIHEGAETIILTLADGTEYDLGAQTTYMLTLEDRDSPPMITINAPKIKEGNRTRRI